MIYKNVYAEVGVHGAITKEHNRGVFVDRVLDSIRMRERDLSRYPYSLGKKLMYGSDWFMDSGVDPADYLLGYEIAFLHPDLIEHYIPFFSQNAADFLDLSSRVNDDRLPDSVRERITEFAE